ncbi:hypothetical protein E2C01_038717 [Portunus trituberculatus]|uniref:Uncharacterized protein n=1 Tax=Portunus trituberculatus TaxID=210409 RepID=A0A5B7FKU1_PORTR|nr:hypothetical protein [Portunus trituberculatus]
MGQVGYQKWADLAQAMRRVGYTEWADMCKKEIKITYSGYITFGSGGPTKQTEMLFSWEAWNAAADPIRPAPTTTRSKTLFSSIL